MSEQTATGVAAPMAPPLVAPPSHRRVGFSRRVVVLSAIAGLVGVILVFQYFVGAKSGLVEPTVSAAPLNPEATGPLHVEVSPAQLKNIELEKVTAQSISRQLLSNGRICFNEEQSVPILAPIAGQIASRRVRVGDRVQKGDVLFSLKSREVAAMKAEYQEALKDRELSEKTCRMTRELFSHNATSSIALQQAENDLSKAQTRVNRTSEQLRVLGLDPSATDTIGSDPIAVRAPRAGTIVESHLAEGQFVQGDAAPLLIVADLSSVWVIADVFERDLQSVRLGQGAEVTTLAYGDTRFDAQVTYVSDVVDPLSRAVKVRLLAANPDGRLKPEMFAAVNFMLGEEKRSIVIPERAVMTENGRCSVFVHTADRAFDERRVQVESAGHGHMRVLNGLAVGEEVVAQGSLLLRHMALSPPAAEG